MISQEVEERLVAVEKGLKQALKRIKKNTEKIDEMTDKLDALEVHIFPAAQRCRATYAPI